MDDRISSTAELPTPLAGMVPEEKEKELEILLKR
jgi:hypothetical protein